MYVLKCQANQMCELAIYFSFFLTLTLSHFHYSLRLDNCTITDVPKHGVPLEIICIASREENGKTIHELEVNENNLKKIMLHPEVKNRPIVVVSIAGAFRRGKSFLLGFFLKYLETQPLVSMVTI